MSSVLCPNNHKKVDWLVFNTEAQRLGGTEVVLELARCASAPGNSSLLGGSVGRIRRLGSARRRSRSNHFSRVEHVDHVDVLELARCASSLGHHMYRTYVPPPKKQKNNPATIQCHQSGKRMPTSSDATAKPCSLTIIPILTDLLS